MFFVAVFIVAFILPTCVSKAATPVTTKVTISKSSVSLYKSQVYQLKINKANKNVRTKSIVWSTSNKKIVTVNQRGYIKGVKRGTAYVYCKVKWRNNKTTTVKCKVKVYNPVKLTGYSLSKTTINLKPGSSTTLKYIKKPSNATIVKVEYASSNKKVATVNSKGVVVAKSVGTCKICCAVKTYNGKVYKKYATVKVYIPVTKYTLSKTSGTLQLGQSTTLTGTFTPSNATDKSLTYTSANTSIATVSNKGVVTAKAVGKTAITVTTSNKITATYTVDVISPYSISMDKKEIALKTDVSALVKASVLRMYGDAKAYKYTSSNSNVASVDNDGQIIGISEGTATISATIINPTVGVSHAYNTATCVVKVTKPDVSMQYTKEPYISTYYFDPRPSYKEEIKIPIYVTDTNHTEYLYDDDSKRFDVLVEVDGKETYIRDMKPGDNTVSLGKLVKGKHYFALQVIDKDSGLKSHKLYNDLSVIDPEEYAIKESETYYMKEEDLTKYDINNQDSTEAEDLISTRDGLTKLFEDTRDAGYRKIVLLKGTYRIDGENARYNCILIPSYFTVDMNESTFKLHTIENDVAASLVTMRDTTEAHIMNGTLEGNRVERKELGLEKGYLGEGINTILFNGCTLSSMTNMTIKQTTGHTVMSQYVWGPGTKISSYTMTDIIDGKEVPSDNRSTSNMIDLTKMKAWTDYVSIGQAEGYRGLKGEAPIIYVHFYDKDKNFMHTVTGYQFRKLRMPKDAVYARVTMLGKLTVEDNVSFHCKHLGDYLEISDIDFYDTRTTALAPSSCNNLLIENVTYTRSGNSITPCAVDFEDGWQECQDVYYRNVEVLEEAGTATLIDNTGYNHVYENVKGHHLVMRRGVMGSVIRNCDSFTDTNYIGSIRWTYGNRRNGRFNRIYNVNTGNISVNSSESDIANGAPKFVIKDCKIEATYLGSTYDLVTYKNCIFTKFNGSDISVENSTIYPTSYLGNNLYFKNCIFKNLEEEGGEIKFSFNLYDSVREFNNCKFVGKTFLTNHNYFNSATFNNCDFEDVSMKVGASADENKPGIIFNKCNMKSTATDFINLGQYGYSVGRYNIAFNDCNIDLSAGQIVYMNAKPTGDSKISFTNCKINKTEGKILAGWRKIADNPDMAMKLIFTGCKINKNLESDYDGKDANLSIIYN